MKWEIKCRNVTGRQKKGSEKKCDSFKAHRINSKKKQEKQGQNVW